MVVVADGRMRCLAGLPTALNATRGGRGGGNGRAGSNGADCVARVPVGTVVWLREGEGEGEGAAEADENAAEAEAEARGARAPPLAAGPSLAPSGTGRNHRPALRLVADLATEGATACVALGGAGGRGNSALRPAADTPGSQRDVAEPGRRGSRLSLLLELKSVADVGLVGPPNVGKSTLLRALTRATPTVADYAFTTLRPQLGVLSCSPAEVLAMRGGRPPPTLADLPGLLPGAALNVGLGHAFLRHAERCAAVVLVVDLGSQVAPHHQLDALFAELAAYDPALPARARLVVATKLDARGAKARLARLRAACAPMACAAVSAHSGEGLEALRLRLLALDA